MTIAEATKTEIERMLKDLDVERKRLSLMLKNLDIYISFLELERKKIAKEER